MTKPIPIIDLFAGPGGLGEGFSALRDHIGQRRFRIALSIEMEASAHSTLQLRAFYRQFPDGEAPQEYYDFLAGTLGSDPKSGLLRNTRYIEEATAAQREAQQLILGMNHRKVYSAIEEALGRQCTEECVLIGGPPCQAYSLAGRSRNRGIAGYRLEDDKRSSLYREYLRIINRFEPAVFVMENVKGLLSARHNGQSIFERIREDLRKPGKAISSRTRSKAEYVLFSLEAPGPGGDLFGNSHTPGDFVIRSEQHGVPQARHRVILLGVRTDILSDRTPGALGIKPQVSLRDVISELPRRRSGLSKQEDSPRLWADAIRAEATSVIHALRDEGRLDVAARMEAAVSAIAGEQPSRGSCWSVDASQFTQPTLEPPLADWYRDPSGWNGVCNHESRGHIQSDLLRYLFCACFSETMPDGKRRTPKADEFPAVLAPAHANWHSGHFADRFRVQVPDRPATTITSHISKDGHYFIHYDPTQCRSLTVREAARVQTFPDNYFFVGNRTQQYVQVGNAVPPYLAHQIAKVVASIF
jgi:DNA (cytosine-5)-methyltransferase 1